MNHREKTIVYTLLFAVITMNGLLLLGRSGQPALAQDHSEEAAADAQDEPAGSDDATREVESIALAGEDGEAVVLRNREGRLAWGDAPHQRAYSVAYVNIGDILNELMQSSEFEEEREPIMAELREEEERHLQRLQEIRSQFENMDPNSEEAQQLSEEGEQIWTEYRQWQQQALDRRGKLDSEHLERAYRTLVDAVAIVAERRDVDIVYRFIPTEDPFGSENPEEAMLNIRLRPVLHYPQPLDLTDAVKEELAIE